jgi:hypothetical protein
MFSIILIAAATVTAVPAEGTLDRDLVCSPQVIGPSSALYVLKGQGSPYLLVERPDGVRFWLSYPGPDANHPVSIDTETLVYAEAIEISVGRVVAGAPNFPGTAVQPVFYEPGTYKVIAGNNLETEHPFTRSCEVEYSPEHRAEDPGLQPAAVTLAGSRWIVTSSSARSMPSEVLLTDDGTILRLDELNYGPIRDFWEQTGASVVLRRNGGYAIYRGELVSEDRITGSATSEAGAEWTWSAVQIPQGTTAPNEARGFRFRRMRPPWSASDDHCGLHAFGKVGPSFEVSVNLSVYTRRNGELDARLWTGASDTNDDGSAVPLRLAGAWAEVVDGFRPHFGQVIQSSESASILVQMSGVDGARLLGQLVAGSDVRISITPADTNPDPELLEFTLPPPPASSGLGAEIEACLAGLQTR